MPDSVTAKPWYLSTTLLFNFLAGVSVLIDWIMAEGFDIVDNPYFVMVVTVVNFLLRLKTQQPVAMSKKEVDVR
jgi:hypothetical protein